MLYSEIHGVSIEVTIMKFQGKNTKSRFSNFHCRNLSYISNRATKVTGLAMYALWLSVIEHFFNLMSWHLLSNQNAIF